MATMAPERTRPQRMEALDRANEVRMYRADIKRRIAAGRVRAWDVLQSDHPLLETMKAMDVLLAAPRVGREKLNKAFVRAKVSPSKTVGGISRRQLDALAEQLSEYPSVRRTVFGVG